MVDLIFNQQDIVGKAGLSAPASTSGAGETILFSVKVKGKRSQVGDSIRIRLHGKSSSTGTLAFKIRVGAAGTLADAVALTLITSAAQVANQHAGLDALLSIRTDGIIVEGQGVAQAAVLPMATAAPVVLTPNQSNDWYITITCACSVGAFEAEVAEVRGL